jgi:hypothetical protein
MLPSALVARFRSDVDDDQLPYLWTDDEVWGYVNDAHVKWVRATGGIRDASTASVVELPVTAADAWLELSPLVMKIRSARLHSTKQQIPVESFETAFGVQGTVTGGFPMSMDDLDTAGPIKALIIGMEDGKLRAVRVPAANDTVRLVVERLPLNTLAAPAASAAPASVTSIARTNTTALLTAAAPHGLAGTPTIIVAGANQAGYNGTVTAQVVSATQVTYTVDDDTVTPATGTITWAPATEYAFEVPAENHLDLLEWMKHLAYLKQDADTYNKTKADEALLEWERRLAPAIAAAERRRYTPRLMAYGG